MPVSATTIREYNKLEGTVESGNRNLYTKKDGLERTRHTRGPPVDPLSQFENSTHSSNSQDFCLTVYYQILHASRMFWITLKWDKSQKKKSRLGIQDFFFLLLTIHLTNNDIENGDLTIKYVLRIVTSLITMRDSIWIIIAIISFSIFFCESFTSRQEKAPGQIRRIRIRWGSNYFWFEYTLEKIE